MINIVDRKLCCACSACVQKCPKHSIIMYEDDEVFSYPLVNQDTCINCNLCEKVCPMLTSNPLVYMLLMVGFVFIFTFMYVKWLQPISKKIIN